MNDADILKGELILERTLCETASTVVQDEDYYKMNLSYYLVEEDIGEETYNLKSYGVEIKKTAVFQDGHTEAECKRISNIFFKREETEEFIRKLAKNYVTPISLKYVVEDYAEKLVFAGTAAGA